MQNHFRIELLRMFGSTYGTKTTSIVHRWFSLLFHFTKTLVQLKIVSLFPITMLGSQMGSVHTFLPCPPRHLCPDGSHCPSAPSPPPPHTHKSSSSPPLLHRSLAHSIVVIERKTTKCQMEGDNRENRRQTGGKRAKRCAQL